MRGSTQPHIIQFSDKRNYLVKFKGNPRGTRVLINEYVCGELIRALGFSGLESQLVAVDDFFITKELRLKERNLVAGLQFASPFVDDHDDFDSAYVQHLTNREQLAQVIAFDTFICNKDRSADNLLLAFEDRTRRSKACEFFMIDHTEAFGATWNEGSIKALAKSEELYMSCVNFDHVAPNMDSFEPSLISLETLTPDKISSIIDGVPREWRFPLGDAVALSEFLKTRQSMIRSVLTKHIGLRGDDDAAH